MGVQILAQGRVRTPLNTPPPLCTPVDGANIIFYNQRRMRWTNIKPTLRKRMGFSVDIDPLLDELVSQLWVEFSCLLGCTAI